MIIRLNGMSDRMGCGGSRPNGVLGWMVVEVVDGDVSSMVVVGLVMAAFRWMLRRRSIRINIFMIEFLCIDTLIFYRRMNRRTNTHYPSKLGLPHILKPSTTVMSENTC